MESDKPCPFCGKEDIVTGYDEYDHAKVYCASCGAEGPRASTCDEAWEKWNKRTNVD